MIEAAIVVDNLMQMHPIGTQVEVGANDEQMCSSGTQTETDSSDEQEQSVGTQNETDSGEEQMCLIGTQILPTSERQVRPLTKLEPQQQVEVWKRAVQEAGSKLPSARIVTDVVQKIMERTRVPNTYQIGEVCQILTKDNPELRGKSGCWAIVTAVNDFSCTVRLWNGECTVGVQHLRSFNYLPDECQQMQVICDRINRVYSSELEGSVQRFLESLGKLKRAFLTVLEEKFLSLLEQRFIKNGII